MVPIDSRPVLTLVAEQIEGALAEARLTPLLNYLGCWLGSIQDPHAWSPPDSQMLCYQDIALSGAVFAARREDPIRDYFLSGLTWIQKRRFFRQGQSTGLEADTLALVSISAGLAAIEGSGQAKVWFRDFISKALDREFQPRRKELLNLAFALLDESGDAFDGLSPLIQVAISDRTAMVPSSDMIEAVFRVLVRVRTVEPRWAIFEFAALKRVFSLKSNIDPAHASIHQVATVLRSVPAGLSRWTWEGEQDGVEDGAAIQRWDIRHDTHVRSLLWMLLRPIFPGLRDEMVSVVDRTDIRRTNLLLPSLKLLISTNFISEGSSAARKALFKDIASDVGRSRIEGSPFDKVLVFIWDDRASTNHHDEISRHIDTFNGICGTIIVSRPGDWGRGFIEALDGPLGKEGRVRQKVKVLFMAANPTDSGRLAIGEEARGIEERIRAAKYRDSIEFSTKWAVRPEDLQQVLMEEEPTVVHFSGHGVGTDGLRLHGKSSGNSEFVSSEALGSLFKVLKDNIRVVVLNACYSDEQAKVITNQIEFVVGMSNSVKDGAARDFAIAFYQALSFGRTVQTAFDLGVNHLALTGWTKTDEQIPQLFVRSGTNASSVCLVRPVAQTK